MNLPCFALLTEVGMSHAFQLLCCNRHNLCTHFSPPRIHVCVKNLKKGTESTHSWAPPSFLIQLFMHNWCDRNYDPVFNVREKRKLMCVHQRSPENHGIGTKSHLSSIALGFCPLTNNALASVGDTVRSVTFSGFLCHSTMGQFGTACFLVNFCH